MGRVGGRFSPRFPLLCVVIYLTSEGFLAYKMGLWCMPQQTVKSKWVGSQVDARWPRSSLPIGWFARLGFNSLNPREGAMGMKGGGYCGSHSSASGFRGHDTSQSHKTQPNFLVYVIFWNEKRSQGTETLIFISTVSSKTRSWWS